MRVIIAACILLFTIQANAETFNYGVKFKGALSGFSWASLGNATITTRNIASCQGWGACLNTRVTMSSKGHSFLESVYPTRIHYQTFFQKKPLRTIAFEKREKKTKSKYQPYGYRHKLVTISRNGTNATYHALWSSGDKLSAANAYFVSKKYNGGKNPFVRSTATTGISKNSLDRWAMIYSARFLPLENGYSKSFPGTNGTMKLTYSASVAGKEPVSARGKTYDAWKVAIIETKGGKKQPTLYLWVSDDQERLPLQIQMAEKIGKVRFNLK